MAMEAPPRPSREELEQTVQAMDLETLQQMGKRLLATHASLRAMEEELDAEKQELQQENASLRETIELMMRELAKLNIGADNTVEPQLLEGPLDFVGRMWEKVKPRDTAVVVSEHVGEIKKPVPGDGSPAAAPQTRGEAVQQVVGNLANAVGPLWQRGVAAFADVQQRLAEPAAAKKQPRRSRQEKQQQQPTQGPVAATAAPGSTTEEAAALASEVAAALGTGTTAAPAVPAAGASAAAGAAAEPAASSDDAGQATAPAAASAATTAVAPAAAADGAAQQPRQPTAGAEETISATILIEAKLKIDDGSCHSLQVRASDRCKDVAKRFVQEHSLKAWFEEPLTKWLKQAENDAKTFPVEVSGDLLEIRKQYSKSNS